MVRAMRDSRGNVIPHGQKERQEQENQAEGKNLAELSQSAHGVSYFEQAGSVDLGSSLEQTVGSRVLRENF